MLWTGGQVSFIEKLAMQSFLDAGHGVRLYAYGDVGGVPDDVTLCDAGEILPLDGTLTEDVPGFLADRFRYLLLFRDPGLVWAECDTCCLGPVASATGHVFGVDAGGVAMPGLLALPEGSDALEALVRGTADPFALPPGVEDARRDALIAARDAGAPVHVAEMPWGTWGSRALSHALAESGEIVHGLPKERVQPVGFQDRMALLEPGVLPDDALVVRLFGRALKPVLARAFGGVPPEGSMLAGLAARHGIDPGEAPVFVRKTRRVRARAGVAWRGNAGVVAVRPLDRVVAVTSMRNEGAFVLDWVAYHLSVGITHFLIYTNDCDGPTNALLDALAAKGLVTRVENPVAEGQKPQRAALDAAWSHPVVQEADAAVVLDVDEFINIHAGAGHLRDLFAAAGDPDLISMTWRLFGCAGEVAFEDTPVPERFTEAASRDAEASPHAWGFKTILRKGAPFRGFGMHRPHRHTGQATYWVNGSGREMPARYLEKGWRSDVDSAGYDLVTLHHYPLRAVESFLVKRDRGLDNQPGHAHDAEYWHRYNRNEVVDRSILPRWAAAQALRATFAADPVIGPLHQQAVDWHRARIAALKSDPGEARLFEVLTAAPRALQPEKTEPLQMPEGPSVPGLPLRSDPPATGALAEKQFRGLMKRTRARHPALKPLPETPCSDRVVVVTSMKNEGCFILEWIAYHLSIGVTHFLVYTNDCDDPTNEILDRLQALGHVTRLDNPFDRAAGQKPQRGALNDAATRAEVILADWVGVIDVDEFVNIHVGDGTFGALLSAAHDPNVISMTWRFFGNAGMHGFEDRWQTEQFTRCAPLYLPKPRLGWGFKSFFRPDGPFAKLGVHRPLDLDPARAGEVRWVNGSGRVMPERVAGKGEWFSRKDSVGYDMVTLNHYVLRAAESYLVKRQRGRINHVDQDQGLHYWASRNYASEEDVSITRHLPRARAVFERLLADEVLAGLHQDAVAWHRARIAALMEVEDYRTLYQAITDPALPDAIWRARPEKDDVLAAE